MVEVEKIQNWTQPAHRLGTEISYPVYKLLEILLTNLHYLEETWKFRSAMMLRSDEQHLSFIGKDNRGYLLLDQEGVSIKKIVFGKYYFLHTFILAIVFTTPIIKDQT